MTITTWRRIRGAFGWGILGLTLLAWTDPASAQVRTGGTGTGASTSSGGFAGGGLLGGGFSGSSGGFSGSSGGFSGSSGSFSGGFSGGSFSGSSGGSFSGSSGSFSGGSFSGGTTGMTGGRTTGGATGFGNTTYQGVSNTNPFYQSYAEPLASGMGSGNTTRSTFGVPMFNLTTTTTGNLTGGGALGTTGGISSATFNPSPATYMTTPYVVGFGIPANSAAAVPTRALPPAVASRLRGEVQQVITQSSALPSKGGIRVSVAGPAVVLQGLVSDEHERRLAEGLVRLTPGVDQVVNELRVRTELATPRPIPPP